MKTKASNSSVSSDKIYNNVRIQNRIGFVLLGPIERNNYITIRINDNDY